VRRTQKVTFFKKGEKGRILPNIFAQATTYLTSHLTTHARVAVTELRALKILFHDLLDIIFMVVPRLNKACCNKLAEVWNGASLNVAHDLPIEELHVEYGIESAIKLESKKQSQKEAGINV
jgi:hypothetical protein